MTPMLLTSLRWLLVVEVVAQPIIGAWMVIVAMRIRRDQEAIRQFVQIWGDRMTTQTVIYDSPQLRDIQQAIQSFLADLPDGMTRIGETGKGARDDR